MEVLNNISLSCNNVEESLYFYTHVLSFSLDKKEKNLIYLSFENTSIILDANKKDKNDITIHIKEKDFHNFEEKMCRYDITINENKYIYDPKENKIIIELF